MTEFGYEELQRAALSFVLENESWPVFLSWARENCNSDEARAWLDSGPRMIDWRRAWLQRSEDPDLRQLGRTLARRDA